MLDLLEMTADGFPSNILHKAQIKINSIKGKFVNDFTQGGEGVGLECYNTQLDGQHFIASPLGLNALLSLPTEDGGNKGI